VHLTHGFGVHQLVAVFDFAFLSHTHNVRVGWDRFRTPWPDFSQVIGVCFDTALVRPLSIKLGLFALALLVAACAEPSPTAASSTTQAIDSVGESTTPTTAAVTTTTTAPASTMSQPAPTTTSAVEGLVDGEPPVIELKPSGYHEMIPVDEIDQYFIFGRDVADSHTTRYTSTGDGESWSITARVDGENSHFFFDESMGGGEMLMSGGDVWVRDESGAWVLDEEMFELPPFIFFPSPDVAYGMAQRLFPHLAFAGWADGEGLAVYRGGSEAVEALEEDEFRGGQVEVRWSEDGYFTMVDIDAVTARGSHELSWTVTEVGTTEVEPPA
jgi:hypothetical protein